METKLFKLIIDITCFTIIYCISKNYKQINFNDFVFISSVIVRHTSPNYVCVCNIYIYISLTLTVWKKTDNAIWK